MKDQVFIKLRCVDCEIDPKDCDLYPYALIPCGNEGCTRKVTEEEAAKFTHYMQEILPFIPLYPTQEQKTKRYNEIKDYICYLCSKPLGTKLDKKGKAINKFQI